MAINDGNQHFPQKHEYTQQHQQQPGSSRDFYQSQYAPEQQQFTQQQNTRQRNHPLNSQGGSWQGYGQGSSQY